jgi:hypothetical protein
MYDEYGPEHILEMDERKPIVKPNILFDFNGVVHSYTSGWKGEGVVADPPVEGIREVLAECQKEFTVVIFSSQAGSSIGYKAIYAWLMKWQIPYDRITDIKIPHTVIVDDRAICFDGNTAGLYTKIKEFTPWKKTKPSSS